MTQGVEHGKIRRFGSVFTDSVVKSNRSYDYGSGVFVRDHASATLTNATVSGNTRYTNACAEECTFANTVSAEI